ncbi:MAG: Txe/YoeB family addiction module toxin [Oscillospiraceae bacterium]|nr:Txe/YoeB family addiction module toxin [Oscillospiraceae bacterium]
MLKPLSFMPEAWEHYLHWHISDRKTVNRINMLLEDILRNGYEGIGKPEPLKGDMAGYWSRRIDKFNRIVYKVEDGYIVIISCRNHYDGI